MDAVRQDTAACADAVKENALKTSAIVRSADTRATRYPLLEKGARCEEKSLFIFFPFLEEHMRGHSHLLTMACTFRFD